MQKKASIWHRHWWHRPSWQKILIALALGIAFGLLAGKYATVFEPIGTIFIHGIHMLVVPVVFTAIICAVLSIDDMKIMRRATFKAIAIYFISMAVSATLGIVVAIILHPGVGLKLATSAQSPVMNAPTSFGEMLVSIVPSNPIQAFISGNVIQILVVALLFGFAIKFAGEPAKPIANFVKSFSSVVFKFASIIIQFAPYGVFALIAYVFGRYGISALWPLFHYVFTVYLACILFIIFFYGLLLFLYGINPFKFIRAISEAIVFSYTTSSSAASLPITLRCVSQNLGVKEQLADFLLPLGTSFNLNGLSMYLSIATIFAANIYGVHLGFMQYVLIVVTIVFTAMGAAAVPGSALIVISAIMTAAGIPLGALTLIAGVDRFNDMAQTATNVIGDCFATAVIAKSEGMMDFTERLS